MADEQFTADDFARLELTLWPKIATASPDRCWPWIGKRDADGYGRVLLADESSTGAHRAAYAMWHRVNLRRSDVVMHTCDSPSCCNPFHLRPGTQTENIADRVAKGRSALGRKPNPIVGKNPPTMVPAGMTNAPRSDRSVREILADLVMQKRLKRQALKASA